MLVQYQIAANADIKLFLVITLFKLSFDTILVYKNQVKEL